MTKTLLAEETHVGALKQDCLPYPEVLAQSVSVIAPSTVPAAIVGLIFATAGNGTWLSFLIGMLGMFLVGLNINQFARRSASISFVSVACRSGCRKTSPVEGASRASPGCVRKSFAE